MAEISQVDRELFENLFVLELANNHLGSVTRGLRMPSCIPTSKAIRNSGT